MPRGLPARKAAKAAVEAIRVEAGAPVTNRKRVRKNEDANEGQEDTSSSPARKAKASSKRRKIQQPAATQPVFAVHPALTTLPFEFDTTLLYPYKVMYFGQGGDGQFGMGEDERRERNKPKLHKELDNILEEDAEALGQEKQIKDIALGGQFTLMVDSKGTVRTCGANDAAQLARDTTRPTIDEANEVEAALSAVENLDPSEFKVARVHACDCIGVALSDQGKIRIWGSIRTKEGNLDDYGLNGVKGARSKEPVPFEPLHLKDVKVVEIATGDNHILALDDQGRVWSFGADSQSCLGRPAVPILRQSTRIKAGNIAADQIDDFERALQPALVDGLKNIVSIACGSYCSYAIDKAGTVYAWGENGNGQCAIDTDGEAIDKPRKAVSLSPSKHNGAKCIKIAGGEMHALFLFDDGSVYAAGRAELGQLGFCAEDKDPFKQALADYGSTKAKYEQILLAEQERLAAIPLEEGEDANSRSVAATQYADAEAPITQVYWSEPQLVTFPEENNEKTKIVDIAVGSRNNIAVSSRGVAYAFGYSAEGQLGLGSEQAVYTPRVIGRGLDSPFKVVQCAAGGTICMLLAAEIRPAPKDSVLQVTPTKTQVNGHVNGDIVHAEVNGAMEAQVNEDIPVVAAE